MDSNKPLSIALEEIAADKIVPQYPGDAREEAERFLGSPLGDDAEVVPLTVPSEVSDQEGADQEGDVTDEALAAPDVADADPDVADVVDESPAAAADDAPAPAAEGELGVEDRAEDDTATDEA